MDKFDAAGWIVYLDHTSSDCRTFSAGGSAPGDTSFAQLRYSGEFLVTLMPGPVACVGHPINDPLAEGSRAERANVTINDILSEVDARYGAMLKRLAE